MLANIYNATTNMFSFRLLPELSQRNVSRLWSKSYLTQSIQRFCSGTLSDTELLQLHETDPVRAAQIYEHRINSTNLTDGDNKERLFGWYTHLRDCYWRLNDDEQISKCAQKLYQLDPKHIYSNFVMAMETYDNKLQLDFLLNAERLITNNTPTNMIADILYRISANYSRQKDLENAKIYIMKLNGVNDESFKVREYVFIAYLDLAENQREKALENFLKAVQFDALDESEIEAKKHALQQIAKHYVSKQDFDNALKYYLLLFNDHKILEIYQMICVCYQNNGAKLYKSKLFKESINTYQQLMDFIDLNNKEYNEMDKEKEKEWNETSYKYKYIAMKHTAQCYNIQRDTKETKKWMMRILESYPNDWLSNYFLGRYTLAIEKDPDKALNYLMKADENRQFMADISDKMIAHAQNLMAVIYAKKGQYQRANVCMEIAFNLCNDMVYLYTSQAMMKATERNYYELYSNLKIANDLKPWNNDNPQEIAAHLKVIQETIYGFEFEYSDDNKIALKCLLMIEYLKENYAKCVEYAVQYRNIDMKDKDVNDIFDRFAEQV